MKITKYVKSVCPSVARRSDVEEDYYEEESDGIKEVHSDDDVRSVAVQEMETNVSTCSLDENYLISKFLSRDGRQHVIVLINLLSGDCLETIKSEVTHGGTCLTISHALCPTFHDIETLQETIKNNEFLTSDKDDDARWRSLFDESRLMKGDSAYVRGEKTIHLPVPCLDVIFQQCSIATCYGKQMLFFELRSIERTVKENEVSFKDFLIKARRCRRRKYCTQP